MGIPQHDPKLYPNAPASLLGYPTKKLERRTGFVKMPGDGTVYSVAVAARIGRVSRDGDKPDAIFIDDVSLPAATWIEAGALDQEAVDFVLSLEGTRRPAAPVKIENRRAEAAKAPPLNPASPEAKFVRALTVYLTSEMEDSDKATFAAAFRAAVRAACGIAR